MYTKKWYMVSMLPKPDCSTYDPNSDVVIGDMNEVRILLGSTYGTTSSWI